MYILLPVFVLFLQDTYTEIEFWFKSTYTLIILDILSQVSLLVRKLTLSKDQISYLIAKYCSALMGQKHDSCNEH